MTSSEIIAAIMDVWKHDADLVGFCETTYGVRPLIRNCSDADRPIVATDCPAIAFCFGRSRGGMAERTVVCDYVVGFAVHDDEKMTDEAYRTEVYLGHARLQQLRDLAQKALLSARIGKISWEGEEDVLMDFPVFTGYMTITVESVNVRARI